ncbi:hypothetical protein TNCV_5124171 [Trichonephila clavipes]|nr:hypothetical protein TNCV_5124171 [Trichonephila clavipes]
MFCDARDLADKIDIPANLELTQPHHTVRRRNVNFDYEARVDPAEDPTFKLKAEIEWWCIVALPHHESGVLTCWAAQGQLCLSSLHWVVVEYQTCSGLRLAEGSLSSDGPRKSGHLHLSVNGRVL